MNYINEYREAEKMNLFMPMWDLVNFRVAKLFSLLKKIENSKILDLGCGHGFFSKYLAERNEVYALDVEDFSRFFKNTNVKFIQHDADKKLPFKDGFFDVVIANEVLEHLLNLDLVLSEIKRVLKKNGTLIADVPNTCLNIMADIFGVSGKVRNMFFRVNEKNIQLYRKSLQFRMDSAKENRYKFTKIFYLTLIFLWQMEYCKKNHVHKHSEIWWENKFETHNLKVKKTIPCCFLSILSVLPEFYKPLIYNYERHKENNLLVKYLSTTLIYLLNNEKV